MHNNDLISKEEKWKAVLSCNKNYDGLFYYGVKTTGIFCRPSCKAKAPLKKNIVFFNNIDDALKEGFRPCKLCRPDIREQSYEPNKDLMQNIMEKLNQNYAEPLNLKAVSQEFGISTSHLTRLFKEYSGVSPVQYITKLRIEKAAELLDEGKINILEAAYMSGFKSLSNFYKCFKEKYGHTPKEHRKRRGDL